MVLDQAWLNQPLTVRCSDSASVSRLKLNIPDIADNQWRVEDGDILKDIVLLLKKRRATAYVMQIKNSPSNTHLQKADLLAKEGTEKPLPLSNEVDVSGPAYSTAGFPGMTYSKLRVTLLDAEPNQEPPKNHDDESALTVKRARTTVYKLQRDLRDKLLHAATSADHWRVAKSLYKQKDSSSLFPVGQLKDVFEKRMNPITPTPSTFHSEKLILDKALAEAIPKRTEDTTPDQVFSRPILDDEVERAKKHLLKHSASSAKGLDNIGYRDLVDIPTNDLCGLLNKCLSDIEAPSLWLSTVLIGIPKRGKPSGEPDNYRTIGLESCFLKLMTLLIHNRLMNWCETNNLLPESQNGFRQGFRTNNNTFILRCAIDRARATGISLYVVFADLSNAFPSTEQSTLWLKLRQMGAGG